jgi:hypothetical protein
MDLCQTRPETQKKKEKKMFWKVFEKKKVFNSFRFKKEEWIV